MQFLHKDDNGRVSFYVEENGEQLGEMVYSIENNLMTIEHTEVDELLRGKNIGFQLIEKGVEFARKHDLKVLPTCRFAKAIIERHTPFQDVLYSV